MSLTLIIKKLTTKISKNYLNPLNMILQVNYMMLLIMKITFIAKFTIMKSN